MPEKRAGHCPSFYCLVYDAIVHTIKRGLGWGLGKKEGDSRCCQPGPQSTAAVAAAVAAAQRFFAAALLGTKAQPPEGSNLLHRHMHVALLQRVSVTQRSLNDLCVRRGRGKTGKRVVKSDGKTCSRYTSRDRVRDARRRLSSVTTASQRTAPSPHSRRLMRP